jgi:phospholipid transport system transporter-binding protein
LIVKRPPQTAKRQPFIAKLQPFIAKRKYSGAGEQVASFEVLDGDRSRVVGSLHFVTVSALLPEGVDAIDSGRAAVIDLAGVTASDSSGLALLIEWLSVAKAAGHALRYENIPSQLQQLARLSEVEELLVPG